MSENLRRRLPDSVVEAEGYYRELRQDREWLEGHLGRYVAIIGREVVGEASDFATLAPEVWRVHGTGPIFMTEVTEGYPRTITYLSPRVREAPSR